MGTLFFGIVVLLLYLLPWILAIRRHHRDRAGIGCLNFFLGWTVVGWGAALAWALLGNRHPVAGEVQRPTRTGRMVAAGVLLLVFGIAIAPQVLLFPVYREGIRLVPLLEQYKRQHGTYPARLEDLGVKIRYPSPGIRGIRYTPFEDGKEFGLVCFVDRPGTTNLREVYSSKTNKWSPMS